MGANTNTHEPILVKIADELVKGQQELDELALQISLGKAEASDKFEEYKKDFKRNIHDYKEFLKSEFKHDLKIAEETIDKLTDLEAILEKGKAESKKIYEEQKQNISEGIENVKTSIKTNPSVLKVENFFTSVSERMRLQMALLSMDIDSKKTELTKEFKDEMNSAKAKFYNVSDNIKRKANDAETKLEHFTDEIKQSFNHLTKAIESIID